MKEQHLWPVLSVFVTEKKTHTASQYLGNITFANLFNGYMWLHYLRLFVVIFHYKNILFVPIYKTAQAQLQSGLFILTHEWQLT